MIFREFRLLNIILPIFCMVFSKRSAQFRYNTSIKAQESWNFMALKFLANSSELLQRSYYRCGNRVIVSRNIFKWKGNIKEPLFIILLRYRVKCIWDTMLFYISITNLWKFKDSVKILSKVFSVFTFWVLPVSFDSSDIGKH